MNEDRRVIVIYPDGWNAAVYANATDAAAYADEGEDDVAASLASGNLSPEGRYYVYSSRDGLPVVCTRLRRAFSCLWDAEKILGNAALDEPSIEIGESKLIPVNAKPFIVREPKLFGGDDDKAKIGIRDEIISLIESSDRPLMKCDFRRLLPHLTNKQLVTALFALRRQGWKIPKQSGAIADRNFATYSAAMDFIKSKHPGQFSIQDFILANPSIQRKAASQVFHALLRKDVIQKTGNHQPHATARRPWVMFRYNPKSTYEIKKAG